MSRQSESPPAVEAGVRGSVDVHLPRDIDSLRIRAAESLTEILGTPCSAAVVVLANPGVYSVELSLGDCPWRVGDRVDVDSWNSGDVRHTPLRYRGSTIGQLLHSAAPGPADERRLACFLDHLSVALVNLQLNTRALASTEHYCASLQAFEEGVVLFQERDPEAVGARFLALLNSLLNTQIGALYVLEKIGDPASPLVLQQVQGMPDWMLDQLESEDGGWWPPSVTQSPTGIAERAADGSFGSLRADSVPEPISSIVHCALHYHGVFVGLALSINVDTSSIHLRLERARRLGELGAALFHRLCLESDALKSREMETQLSIAATIQSRLIPTKPPQSESLTFSWQSDPADYVGGDYVDLLDDPEGDAHAIIADVSGHGIDSALLMASCRAAYRANCRRFAPGKLMEILNNEVHNEVGDTGMFITAASLRLSESGRCTYASAGHNPLLVYRAATNSVERLESTGPSLGFFPGMAFDTESVVLEPGDCLFLYTDGIVEATDSDGEMFGDDRLEQALIENAGSSADTILSAIHVALHEFLGTAKCNDDVSSAVIKRIARG